MKDNISAFHDQKCDEDAAFFSFVPRPDRPELFDEQTSFIDNQDSGVSFHVGGNGCLGGEQEIYDPEQKRCRRISDINAPFHVLSLGRDGVTRSRPCSQPFVKGVSRLYRYSLSSGLSFVATDHHVVLCADETWRPMSSLSVGESLLVARQHRDRKSVDIHASSTDPTMCGETFRLSLQSVVESIDRLCSICGSYKSVHSTTRHASLLSHQSSASLFETYLSLFQKHESRLFRTPSNYPVRCFQYPHRDDEQPLFLSSIYRDIFQQQVDALAHNRQRWQTDGSGFLRECIRSYQQCVHHSKIRCDFLGHHDLSSQIQSSLRPYLQSFDAVDILDQVRASNTPGSHRTTSDQRFPANSSLPFRTISSCRQLATESSFPLKAPQLIGGNKFNAVYITSIEYVRTDHFYDVHVPVDNNYLCAGTWHHNSGTSTAAACKIARLLLSRQEAPRYDCPYWVVGTDYEQTIESMWREKLYGMGFIPDCEINWDRITWYDKRRELPATVPLKPWVNGNRRKNWVLEFRSFAQGRMAMQARALGGFCLTEQFPWEILVEILRGMRQHNIPGSKFCEFTPVDPALSAPLKEMMENNTLPKGWAVYRANTLCNVLDPNSPVDKEWYDEFFGMVGDELLETRRTGAWASYEGLIFKSLNSRVHFVDNAPIPRNAIHKRGIDWGGGPYNALVILWGCKDDHGNWLIYDEYYTTESITWEERIRAIHEKDGWSLVMDHPGPPASYKLEPHPEVPVRWRYDVSTFGQTYAPPDDPGAFRECRHYCFPVVQGKTGLSNSYHPSIECIQAMLRYTPDEFRAGTAPLLKIDRARCPNLARELQILRWQIPPSHATNPRAPKPLQIKDQDHAPDALRALIYSDWIDMQSGVAGHKVELKDRPQIRHRRGR